MGAADVVPGVSGGTVALVLGIYERLISSVYAGSSALGRFARLDLDAAIEWLRRVEWRFLLPLLAGIAIAVISLASLIETQLDDHPIEVAALFLGLVLGSVVIAWRVLRNRDLTRLLVLLVVGVVVFVALGTRAGTGEDTVSQASDPALLAFFLSGAIAICAMILPGISGSLILVLLGMYSPVLDAVTDRELGDLLVFIAGATVGLALFSQLLYRALARHHDTIMATLIGLMLGSTRVLWPWPNGLDGTTLGTPEGSITAAIGLAAIGLAAVFAIGEVSARTSTPRDEAQLGELPAG